MTPAELASRHPVLYHLTRPVAVERIERLGLMSAEAICDLLGLEGAERRTVIGERRPASVTLDGRGERFTINDNKPLLMGPLADCLDGSMSPADWLQEINARVFFWTRAEDASKLAKAYRHEPGVVLEFDTRRLAQAYHDRMSLSPINSGNTRRKAACRGPDTFMPMDAMSYDEWRGLRRSKGLRKGLDRPVEIAVLGHVQNVRDYMINRAWSKFRANGVATGAGRRLNNFQFVVLRQGRIRSQSRSISIRPTRSFARACPARSSARNCRTGHLPILSVCSTRLRL